MQWRRFGARVADRAAPLLVVVLVLGLAADQIAWLSGPGEALHWDAAIHLRDSLEANRAFDADPRGLLGRLLSVSWYYPPLVSWAAVPFYRLLGESELVGRAAMNVFMALLLGGTAWLGARLYDRTTGLVALLCLAAFPMVRAHGRDFMLDLPLAALVVTSLVALVRWQGSRRSRDAGLLGVALGCGLLVKWTFPIFLAAPLATAAVQAARGRAPRRRALLQLGLAIVLGAGLAAPWYVLHAVPIAVQRGDELHRQALPALQAWSFYLRAFPVQAGVVLATPLAIGVAAASWRRTARAPLLVAWLGGGLIGLGLVAFKEPRFALPLLPVAALLGTAGLRALLPGRRPRGVMSLGLATAAVAVLLAHPSAIASGRRAAAHPGPTAGWRHAEILAALQEDAATHRPGRVATLRVVPDHPHLNDATLRYHAQLRRVPLRVAGLAGFPLDSDYVLLRRGGPEADERRARLTAAVLADTARAGRALHPWKTWNLPDGSQALLLRLAPQAVRGRTPAEVVARAERQGDRLLRRWLRPEDGWGLRVEAADSSAALHGRLERVQVRMRRGAVGDFGFRPLGLPVRDLDLAALDVQVDACGTDSTAAGVLSVGSLRVESLCLRADDLRRYLEAAAGGALQLHELRLRDGRLAMRGRAWRGRAPFEIDLRLETVGDHDLRFEFERVRLAGWPLSTTLLHALLQHYNPLLRRLGAGTPVHLGPLRLDGDELRLGGGLAP
jgi:4-amino-4-deoxy-L-arabinose transferase-like glycosyltransferase